MLQEQERREQEELDMMLEENRCKVEEAQRKGALEQQQKELERYLEPERIQKQREEALRQKKIEEEIANQLRLLGTYW
jgi:arginine and glutamate-rich protein 1